jgi:hypothetical protein
MPSYNALFSSIWSGAWCGDNYIVMEFLKTKLQFEATNIMNLDLQTPSLKTPYALKLCYNTKECCRRILTPCNNVTSLLMWKKGITQLYFILHNKLNPRILHLLI